MCRNGYRTGDRTGTCAAHPRDGAAMPRSGRAELDTHALMITDELPTDSHPSGSRDVSSFQLEEKQKPHTW